MKIKDPGVFVVSLCAFIILSGCAQWTITGQNSVWKIGEKIPHQASESGYKLVGIYSNTKDVNSTSQEINNESDAIAISLKTLYLKYIQDIYDFDVIVYAEVYDELDDKKVLKRIAFHRENQPPTSHVNVAGNLLYGPCFFTGYPITVKLYVFELDKKDNALFSDILKVVSSIATTAEPQCEPAIQMAANIMQIIISLNQDDVELLQEITFYPASDAGNSHYGGKASLLAPLETGDFVIVKTEDVDRIVINRWWRFAKRSEEEAKNPFIPGAVYYDAGEGRLKKGGGEFQDKTYAVLSISKPTKAAAQGLLREINDDVQKTLGELLIATEGSRQERIDALRGIVDIAEAEVTIFDIKNRISGKSNGDKITMLRGFLEKYKDKKLVKEGIERLLERLSGTTPP